MHAFILLLIDVVNILIWAVVVWAVMSWMVAFDVIDLGNRFVAAVYDTLRRLIDPLLKPIRNFLPNLGGVDISPIILVLALIFINRLLWDNQFILSP